MAETTSNPDVLIAASCGLKSVRFGVHFYTKADIPIVAVNEQPVQRRMVCLLI
jgi:hypothetical protein